MNHRSGVDEEHPTLRQTREAISSLRGRLNSLRFRLSQRRLTKTLATFELMEKALDYFESEKDRFDASVEEMCACTPEAESLLRRITESRPGPYRSILQNRLSGLSEGTITLSAEDYYQFWTDLPNPGDVQNGERDDIYFLWATSRLSPEYWDEPEMRLYVERQIMQVNRLEKLVEEDQLLAARIKEMYLTEIGSRIVSLKERYEKEGIRDAVVGARLKDYDKSRYERIFVLDDLKDDQISELARLVREQLQGGIRVRFVRLGFSETSTRHRPQDFGVVATTHGETFAMFNDVDKEGKPQGGAVMVDADAVTRYLDCYLRIRGSSRGVPLGADEKQIEKAIRSTLGKPSSISHREVYGNRCLQCLLGAEEAVAAGTWPGDSPMSVWYQIVHEEQTALEAYLSREDIHGKILEIGCGPGRVLKLIGRLIREGAFKRDINALVGYEQNPDIATECRHQLERAGVSSFRIEDRLVGFKEDGDFQGLTPREQKSCQLILAVSNLVGWQGDHESEWLGRVIEEGLPTGGKLFFTVYKRGKELERARMYKAAGDIVKLAPAGKKGREEITLVVDAFEKAEQAEHVSKAYEYQDLKEILEEVSTRVSIQFDEPYSIGDFMWATSVTRQAAG